MPHTLPGPLNLVKFVFTVLALSLGAIHSAPAQAAPSWPAKLFAPYAYIPYEDPTSDCLRETGQRYYTLAFVLGDSNNEPAWDGQKTMRVADNFRADTIKTIREHGGDVIVSFGGEGGKELALTTPDPAALAAKYQAVIDRYHFTWLDFDIEGKTLGKQTVNARRNAALQRLQSAHPGLRVSFTLPGNPTGLEDESLQLLADAKKQGVRIESVNVMTMDFAREVKGGAKMGDLAIQSLQSTHEQLAKLGLPDTPLGVTPMIGENDVKSVIFGPDDAAKVLDFVRQTPWMKTLGFWSVNRDQANPKNDDNSGIPQGKWDFTNRFKPLNP